MYLTPDQGEGQRYLLFKVPSTGGFSSLLIGAIADLTRELNYVKHGELQPYEAAAIFAKVLQDMRYYTPPEIGDIVESVTTKDPAFFLLMDGSTHAAEDWPELFEVLPETWKGASDFTLPNCAGLTLIGSGTNGVRSFPVGTEGGEFEHTLTETEIAAHSHWGVPTFTGVPVVSPGELGASLEVPIVSRQTDPAGGGQPHNNLSPYLVANVYITGKLP